MPTLTAPDLSKLERPNVDLPEIDLSKIEIPKFDLPKVDVGKAMTDAATAVGLMQERRSRWPFVVGAAVALAFAGWAWMNADMIRRRFSDVASMVGDRVGMMRSDVEDESLAFTAAEPKPIESTDPFDTHSMANGSTGSATDYPDGFGATPEMAATIDDDMSMARKGASSRS